MTLPWHVAAAGTKQAAMSRKARAALCAVSAMTLVIPSTTAVLAGVKKASYPEIKVTVSSAYKPDAAFDKLRAAFAAAVTNKDAGALAGLVAPMFFWTVDGRQANEMDLGRDAVHNFKVAFGFRAAGKAEDGGVDDGPYWDTLAEFAADATYFTTEAANLVCGPTAADVADDGKFQQAREKLETDDGAEWYFTLAAADVLSAPNNKSPAIAKVGTVALPALDFYPPAKEGEPAQPVTYIQVLLPSGKTGWIAIAAVRPLSATHLCYAKTPSGDWKIAAVDQPE